MNVKYGLMWSQSGSEVVLKSMNETMFSWGTKPSTCKNQEKVRCKGDCWYIIPHKCPSRELRKYETTLQPFSVLLFPQSSYVVVGRLWDDPKVPSVPQLLIFRSCFWHPFQPLLKVGRGLPKYQLCRPYIPRSALFRKAHTALALRSSTESEDLSYENYPGSENNIEKPIQKCVLCY